MREQSHELGVSFLEVWEMDSQTRQKAAQTEPEELGSRQCSPWRKNGAGSNGNVSALVFQMILGGPCLCLHSLHWLACLDLQRLG